MHRPRINAALVLWAIACIVVLYGCYKVSRHFPCTEEDIFYVYKEGQSIRQGINPYSRIHKSDMVHNDKYATYLPGAYLISSAMQSAGLETFPRWLKYWRKSVFVCHAGIALILFFEIFGLTGSLVACVLATSLWLFNRWSLFVLQVAHIDCFALLLFLLGLHLRRTHLRAAWLLYGASIAVKHMAVFAIPILLIELWHAFPQTHRVRNMVKAFAMLALIPFAVSLPFLVNDAAGLIKSLLFSVTRYPSQHLAVSALLDSMGFSSSAARWPMLALLAGTYYLCWKKQLALFPALCLNFIIFMCYNPVLYQQYLVWEVPFVLLTIFAVLPPSTRPPKSESPIAIAPVPAADPLKPSL